MSSSKFTNLKNENKSLATCSVILACTLKVFLISFVREILFVDIKFILYEYKGLFLLSSIVIGYSLSSLFFTINP